MREKGWVLKRFEIALVRSHERSLMKQRDDIRVVGVEEDRMRLVGMLSSVEMKFSAQQRELGPPTLKIVEPREVGASRGSPCRQSVASSGLNV